MRLNPLIFIAILLFGVVVGDKCDVSARNDCGYMGINQQQCEAKGCCWKPAAFTDIFKQSSVESTPNDTPWCFFAQGQNPCEKIDFKGSQGMGFNDAFYNSMYKLFQANINIQGKGGIVAAPDHSTPGGSYYYHWMRDAALTMRTYMEINNMQLSKVEQKMKAYVGWVKRVQNQTDPNGFDIRINPKFELPNGQVYVGGWCRPQTDGPGLRSAALIMFGNLLLQNNQKNYFTESVLPLIKYDLDWVFNNWSSEGCDLWEEVRSNDFFWGRGAYVHSLEICSKLAQKIADSSLRSRCESTKTAIQATLDAHWTGIFMKESSNRQQDSAVIHAFSSFGTHSVTDSKVAKTIQTLALTFCNQYTINQNDNKAGIPGVLMGRYPGDTYAGGNPWQLLTAVLGKLFYQGATAIQQQNGFLKAEDKAAWSELLSLSEEASQEEFIKATTAAGDAVMYRLYQHVKADGGHIAEQIGRNDGKQVSAKDLTWSFANILSAMKERGKAMKIISQFKDFQELEELE